MKHLALVLLVVTNWALATLGQQQAFNQQRTVVKQPSSQQRARQDDDQSQLAPEPYSFSYMSDSSGHKESRDSAGRVTGSYMMLGDDGRERRVDYVADENGFRASVKTNEIGTRTVLEGDAKFDARPPSEQQLEAANTTALQYAHFENLHSAELVRQQMAAAYAASEPSNSREIAQQQGQQVSRDARIRTTGRRQAQSQRATNRQPSSKTATANGPANMLSWQSVTVNQANKSGQSMANKQQQFVQSFMMHAQPETRVTQVVPTTAASSDVQGYSDEEQFARLTSAMQTNEKISAPVVPQPIQAPMSAMLVTATRNEQQTQVARTESVQDAPLSAFISSSNLQQQQQQKIGADDTSDEQPEVINQVAMQQQQQQQQKLDLSFQAQFMTTGEPELEPASSPVVDQTTTRAPLEMMLVSSRVPLGLVAINLQSDDMADLEQDIDKSDQAMAVVSQQTQSGLTVNSMSQPKQGPNSVNQIIRDYVGQQQMQQTSRQKAAGAKLVQKTSDRATQIVRADITQMQQPLTTTTTTTTTPAPSIESSQAGFSVDENVDSITTTETPNDPTTTTTTTTTTTSTRAPERMFVAAHAPTGAPREQLAVQNGAVKGGMSQSRVSTGFRRQQQQQKANKLRVSSGQPARVSTSSSTTTTTTLAPAPATASVEPTFNSDKQALIDSATIVETATTTSGDDSRQLIVGDQLKPAKMQLTSDASVGMQNATIVSELIDSAIASMMNTEQAASPVVASERESTVQMGAPSSSVTQQRPQQQLEPFKHTQAVKGGREGKTGSNKNFWRQQQQQRTGQLRATVTIGGGSETRVSSAERRSRSAASSGGQVRNKHTSSVNYVSQVPFAKPLFEFGARGSQ